MTIRTPLQTGSILSVVHTEANLAELGYLIPGASRAAADRLSDDSETRNVRRIRHT